MTPITVYGRGVEKDGAAGDARVGTETRPPQRVAEEDGSGRAGAVVVRGEGASQRGLHAEHREAGRR